MGMGVYCTVLNQPDQMCAYLSTCIVLCAYKVWMTEEMTACLRKWVMPYLA